MPVLTVSNPFLGLDGPATLISRWPYLKMQLIFKSGIAILEIPSRADACLLGTLADTRPRINTPPLLSLPSPTIYLLLPAPALTSYFHSFLLLGDPQWLLGRRLYKVYLFVFISFARFDTIFPTGVVPTHPPFKLRTANRPPDSLFAIRATGRKAQEGGLFCALSSCCPYHNEPIYPVYRYV